VGCAACGVSLQRSALPLAGGAYRGGAWRRHADAGAVTRGDSRPDERASRLALHERVDERPRLASGWTRRTAPRQREMSWRPFAADSGHGGLYAVRPTDPGAQDQLLS
jgi:hypothetical protein